ncbi:hypothetical protein Nepgr_029112 [Nepenthes gracilis]|uniref:SURP and G-patch domain-containing protein 1-like protein n=1 Tax=Nepenthes gracilis TaxID=150966 RepID=A0AAD3Y4Q4_NEPGR|nr:hypothetical protein Nepgr_029112 [Nepenthes gracilis]
MDKGVPSSLFENDGSFMERFKQLQQQQKGAAVQEPRPKQTASGSPVSTPVRIKSSLDSRPNDAQKTTIATSGGKLAFSLKQKSKLVAPSVMLGEDDDEDGRDTGHASSDGSTKRPKLSEPNSSDQPSRQDVASPTPSDPTVKKVADKLATFVAKNGRQIEHITRQKNPGDTPFKFLFDESCADYKYYEYRLQVEEKALEQSRDTPTLLSDSTSISATNGPPKSQQSSTLMASGPRRSQKSNYQIPTSALYEANETNQVQNASGSASEESNAPTSGADPIAMMEYYMKKAAQEERKRPPKQSRDEMPPPASLQAPAKRGHHMGDYIPQEELENFLASCNDAASRKAAREAADKMKIQADNVGHKLLSKMGWKEGEGLGSSKKGIADPIRAGDVKKDNLGVGAHQPGEVLPDDDIYEQYKKRMMLGYRYRPNPLNNPRKAYY